MKIKSKDNIILFDRGNWKIVFTGIALIIVGFLLMLGGKTTDPNVFNPDELYSFRRITLAPIIILLGFILQIFAILKKPSENQELELTEKVAAKNNISSNKEKETVVSKNEAESKLMPNFKKKKKKKKKY